MNAASPARPWSRPDYSGSGLANLMASISRGLAGEPEADALPECTPLPADRIAAARHVVLLVIDGLGREQLERHAPQGVLAAAREADLTSVFPSTTASAITTVMTGDPPRRHGLTGWHVWFRGLGVIGAPLPFKIRGGDLSLAGLGVAAPELFRTRALACRLARRTVLVHPQHLCGTPYTEAHRGGAEVRPFRDFEGLCQRIVDVAREPAPSLVYAYWPELDSLSHVHGSLGPRAGEHLRALDRALEDCAARLRGTGTLLLVTADHGFVDTRPQDRLALADHAPLAATLALPLCGEPRMVFCYVQAGAESEFEGYVDERLGHAARWRRARDVIADGLLGPGAEHPELATRLGTHVLFLRGHYCLTDRVPGETRPFAQVGVHGGMSDAELRVPLAVFGA